MEDFETTTIFLEPLRPTPDGRILRMKMSSFVGLIAKFHANNQGLLVTKGTSTMDYKDSLSQGSVSEIAQQASVAVTDKACQTEPFIYPRKIASTPPPHKLSGIALPVQRTAAVAPCGPSSNGTKSAEDAPKQRQGSDPCDVNRDALHVLNCHLTRLKNFILIIKGYRPTEMNKFLLSYVALLMRLTGQLLDAKRDRRIALQIFESTIRNGLATRRLWRAGWNPHMRVPPDALQYPGTVERFSGQQQEKPDSHYRDALCNDTVTDSPEINAKYPAGDTSSRESDVSELHHEISRSTSPSSKRARHEIPPSSQETARPSDPRLPQSRSADIVSPTRYEPQISIETARKPELNDNINLPCSSAVSAVDVSPRSDVPACQIAASDTNNDTQCNSNTTALQNTESKPSCALIGNVSHATDIQQGVTAPIAHTTDSRTQAIDNESDVGKELKPVERHAESDTKPNAYQKQPLFSNSVSNHIHSPVKRRRDRFDRDPRSSSNTNGHRRLKSSRISTQITQRAERDWYEQDHGGGQYGNDHHPCHDPNAHINDMWSLGRTHNPRGYYPPRMEDYAAIDHQRRPHRYRRGRYY